MNRWVEIVVLLCFGALLLNSTAKAADPFYERLLREGTDAYNRGEFDQAIRYLRLANFGFLEEPDLLARGLSFLALAQAKVRDTAGFRETFLRIAEVEERFRAYTRADIDSDMRSELERTVSELVPRATLETTSAFAHLVDRTEESRVSDLSGRDKRRELRRLIAENPRASHWRLMLAQMDLDEGRTDDAIRNASTVLEYDGDNLEALLIRGLAMVQEKKWDAVVSDLTASGVSGDEERRAEALLRAYVELGRWQEASDFVASLPDGVRGASSIQGMVQLVERNREGGDAEPSTSRVEASSLSRDDAETLQRVRTTLDQSTQREDLLEAYRLARSIAERMPHSARAQHLAGQAAYRLARWAEAATYFRRGGNPPESQPVMSFYMAVSLYESGEVEEAAKILRSCIQKLQHTPFVESYITKILGNSGRQ